MTKRAVVFCVKGLHIMLVAMAITSLVKKYHSDSGNENPGYNRRRKSRRY